MLSRIETLALLIPNVYIIFAVVLLYIGHGRRNTGDWCFQDGFITFRELAALYLLQLCGRALTVITDCSYSGCWVKDCMTFLDEQGVGPCGHAAKKKGILINVYAFCLSHQIPRKLAFSVKGCRNDKKERKLIFASGPIADCQETNVMDFTNVRCGQEYIDDECLCLPGATWKKWSERERIYPVMSEDLMKKYSGDYGEMLEATCSHVYGRVLLVRGGGGSHP